MKLLILLISGFAFGHGDHHSRHLAATVPRTQVLKEINSAYVKMIKPIFKRSCFDCHSIQTVYPWYHSVPIVKQIIDHDIKEGLDHLDLTNDFPFKSHATPKEDLESIREEVAEGEMPPWKYRLLHSESSLTEEEKRIIFEWVDRSLKLLQ